MFEALLVENPDDLFFVLVEFNSGYPDYRPFAINGMNHDEYYSVTGDLLVTITTDEILSLYDNNMVYQFQLSSISLGSRTVQDVCSIILHEKGQLFKLVNSCCWVNKITI